MTDEREYATLPDLRARAAAERKAGHEERAGELEARIAALSADAKRAAARVVRERAEAKERFQRLVNEIRELQGSAAEVPGGPEARDARIRELTAEANAVKADHDRLNGRVRRFRWYLTGEGGANGAADAIARDGTSQGDRQAPPIAGRQADAEGAGGPDRSVGTPPSRRRLWLVPAIVGSALLLIAGGLFLASLLVDRLLEERVEVELAAALADQGLDDLLWYESVDVSSIAGSVTAREVVFIDPVTGGEVRADAVTLTVPHLEALRARDALAAGDVGDVGLSRLGLTVQGAQATVEGGQAVRVDRIRLVVEGDLDGGMLAAPLGATLPRLRRAETTMESAEVTGVERALLEELRAIGWMGDVRDFLVLDEARIVLEHDREAGRIALSDYRMVTPLIEQHGSAELIYEGDLELGDIWLRRVEVDLTHATPSLPAAFVLPGPYEGEGVLVDIPAVDVTASGAMTFRDEWMEPELSGMSGAVNVNLGRGAITLPPSMVEELAWTLPGAADLLPDREVSVDEVSLDATLARGGAFELRELAFDAPLAALTLEGRGQLDEVDVVDPGSLVIEGTVVRLPASVRELAGDAVAMMGATLPVSGPFGFSLALDDDGQPRLDVR